MKTILIWQLFFCAIKFSSSARIFGAFIFPSYSHQIVFQAIWEELAIRGHDVVILTTHSVPNASIPNLRLIEIPESRDIWSRRTDLLDNVDNGKSVLSIDFQLFGLITESMLKHPEVQGILRNPTEHFDLVMVEWLHPGLAALSAKFKCPLIGVSSLELLDVLSMDIGNPIHPVLHPNFFLPSVNELSFWERLTSIEFSIWLRRHFDNEIYPFCDKIAKRYIGDNIPPVKEIASNISLMFININKIFAKPRANIPTIVEFSGIHLKPPKPLPEDIQIFLDDAPNGVVYFSLGSSIKSNMLSNELKQNILDTFKELPYKVLWKFDNFSFHDLTDNIKISEWLPQQDILTHPNIKVFITQGGLQSLEEAVRRKVPLVGIPFIVDQPKNMNKMMQLGIGRVVDKSILTKDSFKMAIIDVAENSKYRKNIAQLAEILEDEPMNSMDKIMWWTEYVLKHKGTRLMRSPYLSIPMYQYFFIDIFAFVTICLGMAILFCFYIIKSTLRLILRHNKHKVE